MNRHLILTTLIAGALAVYGAGTPVIERPQPVEPVGFLDIEIGPGTNTVKSSFKAPHVPTLGDLLRYDVVEGDRVEFGTVRSKLRIAGTLDMSLAPGGDGAR